MRLSMEVACSPVKDFYLLQSKDCDMIIVRYNANSSLFTVRVKMQN